MAQCLKAQAVRIFLLDADEMRMENVTRYCFSGRGDIGRYIGRDIGRYSAPASEAEVYPSH